MKWLLTAANVEISYPEKQQKNHRVSQSDTADHSLRARSMMERYSMAEANHLVGGRTRRADKER